MLERLRNFHAALQWRKAKLDAHAAFHFHKDALLRIFPALSNPGRRSQKEGHYSAASTRRKPIGRRGSPARVADANRSIVQFSSAYVLIVPLTTNRPCVHVSFHSPQTRSSLPGI